MPAWVAIILALISLAKAMLNAQKNKTQFRELKAKIVDLEAKDDAQQGLIDGQRRQIARLRGKVMDRSNQVFVQRRLKHACREELHAMGLVVQLYRKVYGQHAGDILDLTRAYAFSSDNTYVKLGVPEPTPPGTAEPGSDPTAPT